MGRDARDGRRGPIAISATSAHDAPQREDRHQPEVQHSRQQRAEGPLVAGPTPKRLIGRAVVRSA